MRLSQAPCFPTNGKIAKSFSKVIHPVPYVATWLPRLLGYSMSEVITRIPENRKCMYLTFDDGPSTLTPYLLDILQENRVPATFFLLGVRASMHPEFVSRMLQEGHAIGNHGWLHEDPWRTSSICLQDSLIRTETLLANCTKQSTHPIRPPYGHITPFLLRWCRETHHPLVLWDIMPGDFLPVLSVDDMLRFTLHHLREGSILVLHDHPRTGVRTLSFLQRLIPYCLRKGWTFDILPL